MNKGNSSRRGWAAVIDRHGMSFVVFAKTPGEVENAWVQLTGSLEFYDKSLLQHVDIRLVSKNQRRKP